MSGRVTPQFLDEIRARLPVSQVVGRKVALKKAGREWKGLSPFKIEKTPSFTVNDAKGFYHCFATGEHGDIFKFVMTTEGLDFLEAVERLAGEAGLPMPKRTERSEEDDDQRERLYRLLEISAKFFEDHLRGGNGRDARAYIEKRGLKRETLAEFRLGYAPASRTVLKEHLKGHGVSFPDMIASGMLIGGSDIPDPYDRFRNRIMFPIQDLKGRVIAFGGRALEKDAPAKYLNSPETPLFHKGHHLFNAHRARPLAHDLDRIIVVEGYMDVIALCEAGFGDAVAPLGTALTEDQVKMLWRFTTEPTLCFDGDLAGKKAAFRAVDTALPHLKPGHSLKFAFLPQGLDPDDLIRQHGSQAMGEALGRTRSLVDVLWDRELASAPLETPEQRAALDARLRGLLAGISDQIVRGHYEREIKERLFALNRVQFQSRGGGQKPSPGLSYARPVQTSDWRQRERNRLYGAPRRFLRGASPYPSVPAGAGPELSALTQTLPPREALILKTLLNHPWLVDQEAEAIADLPLTSHALQALRDEILSLHASANSLDSATLRSQLSQTGVSKVVDLVARTISHASDRFAEPEASPPEVEAAWHHILALHQRQAGLEQMRKAAEDAWYRDMTEDAQTRLLDVQHQLAQLNAVEHLDQTQDSRQTAGPQLDVTVTRAG